MWGPNTFQLVKDECPGQAMGLKAEFSVTYLLDVLGKVAWMNGDEIVCWLWPKMGQSVEGTWAQGFGTMEGDHRRRNRGLNVAWHCLCQRYERPGSCDGRKKRSACVSDDRVLG